MYSMTEALTQENPRIHSGYTQAYELFSRQWIEYVRLEVFSAVTMKNGVFWDVNAAWLL
jgi:hypothetical protein